MKTFIGIVVLGVVVGGLYLLNDLTRGEDGKSLLYVARELEIQVEAASPEQRDIIRTVQAPGEVEAFAEVDISSELVAKILEMPVEEGDRVQKGDLLCRLDDADYQARVRSGEANVAKLEALIMQAEADLDKAERDWERQKRLSEVNATSVLELADYRTVLIRAQAGLETRKQELVQAEAALQSAREDLAKTVITAPMSGVVSQLFADQGEVVVTGTMNPGTRIMVISDLSKTQVRCRVDETDAPLVAPGQTTRIYLQSDTRKSIPGEVLRVATKGTKQLGRDVVFFETLVLITGDDPRVKPGMTANLEIKVDQREDALTIPVEAVVYRKRRDLPEGLVRQHDQREVERDPTARQHVAQYIKLVFCVTDGKARPHLVETGISDATSVEIVDGIALADMVVTGPYRSLDQLKDEAPVKLKEKPKAESEEHQADDDEQDRDPSEQGGDQEPAAEQEGETALVTSNAGEQAQAQADGS